jgi:hypothetical protein
LTPATGARTTRFCRTLQCRSSAAPPIAHGPKPALQSVQRSGRCRVHRIPCPTSVTIAIRPSWRAGTGRLVGLIWGRREEVYFCGEDWTGQITLIGLEKFVPSRIAPQDLLALDHNPPQKRFRSARLHFSTRWIVLAYPKFQPGLRGPRCEPVFLHASARGGFDAHGVLRSSCLAHLR